MKKTLLATAALVVAIASPAFAQSHDPDLGSGNLDGTRYVGKQSAPIHIHRRHPVHARTARRASPAEAYAQSPQAAFPRTPALTGYRLPGAKYDADGRFIDQNSPGRW